MKQNEQTNDGETLALGALGWVLAEDARAARLLALTGLDPEGLRRRLGEPALLVAMLLFLEGHEPDLVACAEALGTTPLQLVETRRRFESGA